MKNIYKYFIKLLVIIFLLIVAGKSDFSAVQAKCAFVGSPDRCKDNGLDPICNSFCFETWPSGGVCGCYGVDNPEQCGTAVCSYSQRCCTTGCFPTGQPCPTSPPPPPPTSIPIPTSTPTPTPIGPTPTINPNCQCASDVCSTSCSFDYHNQVTNYTKPPKCNLSDSLFSTPPTSNEKNGWCKSLRVKGDADGSGVVDIADYFLYVGVVFGGKIPPNVNPDFNGDGEVGRADLDIYKLAIGIL